MVVKNRSLVLVAGFALFADVAHAGPEDEGELPPEAGPAELADAAATATAASVAGDTITLQLFPKASRARDCDAIGHAQFLQMSVTFSDGTRRIIKPSELRARDAWLDAAVSAQGHAVDTCTGFVSPMYQDATASSTRNGRTAEMTDTPRVTASDLRNWSVMRWSFTTYGYCDAGKEKGAFYEGVTWTWDIPVARVKDGDGFGTLSVTATDLAPPADGSSFHEAVRKWQALPRRQAC